MIVLEIGGNDLLAWRRADVFRADLDALVAAINAGGHYRVIVVELPLPPLANRYGLAQRRAIRALPNRVLLPKRVLAGILTARGATVDGIHFSPKGHEKMAEAIRRVIEPR
jgi:lysophospholipase L1-like esterase